MACGLQNANNKKNVNEKETKRLVCLFTDVIKASGWHFEQIPHMIDYLQHVQSENIRPFAFQTGQNQNLIGFEIKHKKEFIFNWIISSKIEF